jgi:hypothetical protein
MNDWRYDNLTHFHLKQSKKWYKDAKEAALPYEKVEALDRCLSACEKNEKFMHMLGRPVPPEREVFWNKAKAKRERYAQAQKDKEDNEFMQRINALFVQL